ncbi:hypothetical protein SAMN04488066_1233 [Halorubrum aquaticum]|uniref:Uncharacterized protein n=1 Tax=Halorubrum aquaticum TaxID=387340 RepID=A0A1I3AH98_9EURY|nr:DUF6663 family protein [Halorubrum aquaticum]SFH49079.1 hypothetical protein SAMN04488066_105201 [Halorubrum aquaticum]SFH73998.1 hypothetical protein SAMN04488066_1233 [Halorubrum aquaticum]
MNPTTTGRFRVHDRRPRPVDGGDGPAEFVLVELPEDAIDPTDPDAAEAYDPLYATATGYEGELAERVADLDPGNVVDATLAWEDGTARFTEVTTVRESRFRFADGVEGMFEAAVDAWRTIRADGEAMGSVTTRSTDGEPNGALYLFADGSGTDTFAELRAARLPVEPLVDRVNETRGDDAPREVFVLRPAAHEFVAVYVVFERDGVLARTVRDTYGLGDGLAAGLESAGVDTIETGGSEDAGGSDDADDEGSDDADDEGSDDGPDGDGSEFDLTDRL